MLVSNCLCQLKFLKQCIYRSDFPVWASEHDSGSGEPAMMQTSAKQPYRIRDVCFIGVDQEDSPFLEEILTFLACIMLSYGVGLFAFR